MPSYSGISRRLARLGNCARTSAIRAGSVSAKPTPGLPPAKLRVHIDSKIVTTQLGNEAGVPSAPNTLGRANSYEELMALGGRYRTMFDLQAQRFSEEIEDGQRYDTLA